MVQINEISPSRFRAGDLITIRGFGFAPTFGDNAVAIDGIPEPIQSESATEIVVVVPAGVTVGAYVPVFVFRSDTLENDSNQAWSSDPLDDLRDGTARIPGQLPGVTEAADPSRVEDVPQAQDYERLATAIEHLLFDVLGTTGDVFASDGTSLVPQPVGAAGQRLGANPAPTTGMEYAAITRATSLRWQGEKAIGDVVLGALTANGGQSQLSLVNGLHLAQLTGNVYLIVVLFAQGTAGDTLDQVRLRINAVTQYDSLVGLGIAPGGVHVAAVAVAVTAADTVELEVKKLGVAGLGRFVGTVGVR